MLVLDIEVDYKPLFSMNGSITNTANKIKTK